LRLPRKVDRRGPVDHHQAVVSGILPDAGRQRIERFVGTRPGTQPQGAQRRHQPCSLPKKLAARLLAYISQDHPRHLPGRRTVHHRKVLTQFTSRGGVSGAQCRDTADTCRCPRNWCTGRHSWSLCTWCTGPIRHTRRTSLFVHSFHRLPMNQAGREGRDAHRDVFGATGFR
jgi:hypothetical protein